MLVLAALENWYITGLDVWSAVGGRVPLSVASSIAPRRLESGSNVEGPVETSKLEGSR